LIIIAGSVTPKGTILGTKALCKGLRT